LFRDEKRVFHFDRDLTQQWIDNRLAKEAAASGIGKSSNGLDNANAQHFIRGGYDRDELKDKAKLKRLASKYCHAIDILLSL
jgi:hypothetical protein